MNYSGLMAAFPPTDDKQVTLANWRQNPFSEWGFQNVRELLPTANIKRSLAPTILQTAPEHLDDVSFTGLNDTATTVAKALHVTHTDGFVVLHRGKIVSEWYDHGLCPHKPHLVFSVSKSIAGTIGGILAGMGKLDCDAPVVSYIPEMKRSVYGGCKVQHLLDMSVGIQFDEDYLAEDGDVVRYRRATGWDAPDSSAPPIHLREYLQTLRANGNPHGGTFHYVSTNTEVLGWIFERVCGMSYAKIIGHYLWSPLGAEDDAYITVDSHGAARAAGGICATPRDLARFGEMMRNNGISNGRQVVPGRWIDDIRQNGNVDAWMRGDLKIVFPNGNYRNKWYTVDRDHTAFAAVGIHGQWIYVDPSAETVIVRVSSQPLPVDLGFDHMWIRGYRAISEALKTGHRSA
jgi:CubicO group peptidase (beta-lactamase class C family)